MYSFILNMWIMRKIGEAKVLGYVTKGYITQIEAEMTLSTPQMSV